MSLERPSTASGSARAAYSQHSLRRSRANSLTTRLSLALLATPPQPPQPALHPQFFLLQLLLLPCSLPASVHHTRTLLPIKRANNCSSSCPVRLYRVVYSHSAAIQHAPNHPCHAVPKFGPYLPSHNLSEGEAEFGKAKPGLYTSWGEEAAIKLIIRHNVDSVVCKSNEGFKFSGFVIFLCSVVAPAPDNYAQAPKCIQTIRRYQNRQVYRHHSRSRLWR